VLRATGGTCRAPVGAHATISGDAFSLLAGGVNSDGSGKLVERMSGTRAEATGLATRLGRRLLADVGLR
jgi:porphobilinogen deaminase